MGDTVPVDGYAGGFEDLEGLANIENGFNPCADNGNGVDVPPPSGWCAFSASRTELYGAQGSVVGILGFDDAIQNAGQRVHTFYIM